MSKSPIPVLPCLFSSFRRTARALTQMYDEAFRPLGLRGTQFTILQVLSCVGEVPQRRLGEILAMDSTTLTRTLKIMVLRSWIAERSGADRRERLLRLAKAGEVQFQRALPPWNKAQARLRRPMGEETWNSLLQLTHQVTDLARDQGESK